MKIRPLTAILALTSLLYTACLSVTSEPTDDSDDLIADIETGVEDEPETGDNTPTGAGQPPTQKDVGVLCVDDQGNQEGDSCIDPCTEAFGDYGCNEAGELVCVPYEAVTNLLCNGKFEQPVVDGVIPYWTVVEGNPQVVSADDYDHLCSQHALRPLEADGAAYVVRQVALVDTYKDSIDAGEAQVVLTDLVVHGNDVVGVGVEFFDAHQRELGREKEDLAVGDTYACHTGKLEVHIPVGTRTVNAFLYGENLGGNTNNATHDEVHLKVTRHPQIR